MLEFIQNNDPILIGGVVITVILIFIGIFTIRSGNRSKYFRLKRKRVETGWKWVFGALLSAVLVGGYFYFVPRPEPQVVATITPTIKTAMVDATETPMPAIETETEQPTTAPVESATSTSEATSTNTLAPQTTITNTPLPTSTMRPSLTPSLTNTIAPTFTPVKSATPEATWTHAPIIPTLTNTRQPTATEPAPTLPQ